MSKKSLSYNQFKSKLKGRNLSSPRISDLWDKYKNEEIDENYIQKLTVPPKQTVSNVPTEILLHMTDSMGISDVLRLCKTNKNFGQFICKNDTFWIKRLKRDFGNSKREGNLSYYQQYVRNHKIKKEYEKYPELEEQIKEWLKDTEDVLEITNLGLQDWPEVLKGREHLIKNLECHDNNLTSLPRLPNCEIIDCNNNYITKLPTFPNCTYLNCNNNKLNIIAGLPNCVQLFCTDNNLVSLPNLPNCKELWCRDNKITSLPPLPKCTFLNCARNKLTSLPVLQSITRKSDLVAKNNPFPKNYKHRLL